MYFTLITIIDETSHAELDEIELFIFSIAQRATEDLLIERRIIDQSNGCLVAETKLVLRRDRVRIATVFRSEAATALLGLRATWRHADHGLVVTEATDTAMAPGDHLLSDLLVQTPSRF